MMRRRSLILASGALVVGTRFARATAPSVVLELFTSQGCASCPPADALLTELAARQGIVALSWHIDYWNKLGWRDPYASPVWTARQRQYAARLQEEVYTPALVLNGARMVVGSNRAAVADAITLAGALPVAVELRLTPTGLMARTGQLPDDATVTLITYDAVRATPIGAGENSGRTLQESHIVRSAIKLQPGRGDLTLPPVPSEQGVVLLVYGRDLAVLGAAQVRAPGEPAV